MSGKRYPEEFKIEAVKQVTDRGYKIGEVARRLGVTPKSMHEWIKRYGDSSDKHQEITAQQAELRRLRADLRRVTEGRDMSKVPHPFVTENMEFLEHLSVKERNKVWFIHMNHTNPLLNVKSKESKTVQSRGFNIAVEGIKLNL